MSEPDQSPFAIPPELVPMATFLESKPPGKPEQIAETAEKTGRTWTFVIPAVQLHCDSEHCGGVRFFDTETTRVTFYDESWKQIFVNYSCRHCKTTRKVYALTIHIQHHKLPTEAIKLGEWPIFAPHVPSRVLSMVGKDQELFLKGRRAESLGMGIAAFAYYRRAVENQKSRLIDQILMVARRIQADASVIARLEEARDETQFSTAVERIKDAMPEVLRIDGHSPLTLLHSALSEGLHAQSDDQCLELATSIRVLLSELCDRISTALKDHAELKSALSRILNRDQANKPQEA
jgi:hypothetical protein